VRIKRYNYHIKGVRNYEINFYQMKTSNENSGLKFSNLDPNSKTKIEDIERE